MKPQHLVFVRQSGNIFAFIWLYKLFLRPGIRGIFPSDAKSTPPVIALALFHMFIVFSTVQEEVNLHVQLLSQFLTCRRLISHSITLCSFTLLVAKLNGGASVSHVDNTK